jgi:RNA polymerase sigma factor (sigma-70 family)
MQWWVMDEIATVVEPFIPGLRRYAWALLRDQDAADDLVQDCLERAIRGWRQRRHDGNLRVWLLTILRNLFISGVRQKQRRGPHVALDEVTAPLVEPSQETYLHLRMVLAALDALPEEQRSVLLLVGVEDLSYDEAARVLDVPVGTVMSRLSRGRERLRQSLDPGTVSLRRVK